jgi:hypothetical protein
MPVIVFMGVVHVTMVLWLEVVGFLVNWHMALVVVWVAEVWHDGLVVLREDWHNWLVESTEGLIGEWLFVVRLLVDWVDIGIVLWLEVVLLAIVWGVVLIHVWVVLHWFVVVLMVKCMVVVEEILNQLVLEVFESLEFVLETFAEFVAFGIGETGSECQDCVDTNEPGC